MTVANEAQIGRTHPEWTYEIVFTNESGKEEICCPVVDPASAHHLYGLLSAAYRRDAVPSRPELWLVRNGTVRTLLAPTPTL
jgi:hypothetical protein